MTQITNSSHGIVTNLTYRTETTTRTGRNAGQTLDRSPRELKNGQRGNMMQNFPTQLTIDELTWVRDALRKTGAAA